MSSSQPPSSTPFNPFLKRNAATTTTPAMPTPSGGHPTGASPFGTGVKPVSPFPGSSAAVAGSVPPFPSTTTAPPPMATPFMPRSGIVSAPPLSSAIPPPPVEGTSPLPEMSPTTATTGSSRMKKGMTAAQLYSLHTIGGETMHAATTAENTAETQKAQEVPKEEKPMKPCSSSDRINLNRIPHPEDTDRMLSYSFEADEDYVSTLPYPCNQFIFKDTGNANPRYMRPTMRVLPQSYYMFNKAKVPASIFVTPFAEPDVGEESLPEVDGRQGLVRCHSCWAYMNPYCTFINQGHGFICNLCGAENPVPSWYYATTDMDGKRFDRLERPELSRGSYDIIAGKEFYDILDPRPVFCFVLDVARNAHSLGVFGATVSAIEACVEMLKENERSLVGICVVDTACHMLSVRNHRIHEVMMTDSDDSYAVIHASQWLLSPASQGDDLAMVINYLRQAYSPPVYIPAEHNMIMSAVKTVAGALAYCGGHIIAIESIAPMLGPGRVSASENGSIYGTEDESVLYLCSQDQSYYTELGTACALSNISVDIIIACKEHVHLAEQQIVAYHTGGHVYVLNDIENEYHDSYLTELHAYIQNLVIQPQYTNIIMKLRISGGIKVESYCGCITLNEDEDPIACQFDSDSTVEISLDIPKYLTDASIYAQIAVLYPFSSDRYDPSFIHTQTIRVKGTTDTYPRFFKGIDGTAIAMSLARTASIQSDTIPLTEVRGNLQDTVEEILTQYRTQCSASSSTGQLVLPENGKFLPLWLNCILKSPLLLLNEQGKRDVLSVMPRGDIRAWAFQYVLQCSPSQFLRLIYPTLYKLDPLDPMWGTIDDASGYVRKPRYLFLTSASLDLSSVYLLSCWRGVILIVGNQVSSEITKSLFGVEAIPDAAAAGRVTLLSEGDEYCSRVNVLVNDIQSRYGYYLQPRVVVRGTVEASRIMELMTEDAVRSTPSFSDFLMQVHSNIIASVFSLCSQT